MWTQYFGARLLRRTRRGGRAADRVFHAGASLRSTAEAGRSAAIVAVVGLSAFVVPVGARVQQEPIKEAALLARSRGYEVIMWRLNAPSFSVYYGRPTPSRDPRPGDIVITKAKRLAELPGYGSEVLYAKNGIVLVRVTG